MVECKFFRLLSLLFTSVLLLVLPWFHGTTGLLEQLIAQTGVYLFFLFLCVAALWLPKSSLPQVMTDVDAGFFLAAAVAILSIGVSVLPLYSLMTAVRFGAVIFFYVLVRLMCNSNASRSVLLAVILAAGVFYGVYGILQLQGLYPKDYWYETHSLASRYVNSGHFAGFLVMPFFSALIFMSLSRSFVLRLFLFCLLLFIAVVLVLTKSRTLWVSLTAGVIFFLFLISRAKPFSKKTYVLFAVGGLLLTAGAFFSGVVQAIAVRFSELMSMNFFSISHRFHFWQGSAAAILERPWGWGLGTFVHIFPHFRVHSDRFIVDYAHNELLQLGVDLGILGIVTVILLGALYFLMSCRSMRFSEKSYSDKVTIAGITAGMLTLTIASQFDFPLRVYANAFFAAAFLGIQSSLMDKGNGTAEIRPLRLFVSRLFFYKRTLRLVVFTLAGLVLSGFYLRAEICYQSGHRLEKNFEWDLAMQSYEGARRYAPWTSEYDEAAGRLAEKRAALMMNAEDRSKWLNKAMNFYLSATEKNSFWPASFYKVGVLKHQLGDKLQAERYLGMAHEKDPTNPLFTFEYVIKQLELGQVEEGIRLLESFVDGGYYDPVPLTQKQLLEKIYIYVKDVKQLRRCVFDMPFAQFDFGLFLLEKGQRRAGSSVLEDASQAIRKQYGYSYYLEYFGGIAAQELSKAGLHKEAVLIYEEAVQKSPNAERYRVYLSAAQKMKDL